MDNLKIIDDYRNDRGLAKRTTKTLETVVKKITQGEEVITLAESDMGSGVE